MLILIKTEDGTYRTKRIGRIGRVPLAIAQRFGKTSQVGWAGYQRCSGCQRVLASPEILDPGDSRCYKCHKSMDYHVLAHCVPSNRYMPHNAFDDRDDLDMFDVWDSLTRLEEAGYIIRENWSYTASGSDERRNLVHYTVTEKGKAHLYSMRHTVRAWLKQLISLDGKIVPAVAGGIGGAVVSAIVAILSLIV